MKPRSVSIGFHLFLFSAVIHLIASVVTAADPPPAAMAADRPPIRSAAEIDYPPFSYAGPDGRATGFSVELMRAALSAMGREVTFKTGPWMDVRGWLEKGEIDALPLVGRTPERESLFDFTVPYMTLHGAIVVRKGEAGKIWDLKDLKGRVVAVMQGDNAEEFLRREDRGIVIQTTPSFEEAFRILSRGGCDAVVVQRLVALRLLRETGITNLEIVNRPIEGFRQDFCFAVTEGGRETLALLNEGLALVTADGTHQHLHAKWFASLELPEKRRIVIGGDHNYPPFEFLDETGRPAGFNVDLTRAIARETGMDIEIRLGPWSKNMEELAAGEIDAIQGMYFSPERDRAFDFTPPYIVNHCVAVVRKDGLPLPEDMDGLAALRIVVQEGDILHDFVLKNGLWDRLSLVDAQEDALRDLAEGKQDCALVARMTALYWIKKYGWDHLTVGDRPLLSPEYCYAVPNNNKALLAQLSEGLKIVHETGEYRRIYEKWMGGYDPLAPDFFTILRWAAFVIVPLTMLLLGFFLWNHALRRQVMVRTEALRQNEEFQRAMIECSPVALYSIDIQGRVSSWNASAERVFGWTAEEVMGSPLPIVSEDRKPEMENLRQRILSGEIVLGKEVVRRKKDGALFDGSLSAAPIRDKKGDIIGIMGAMEDITGRIKSEDNLRFLTARQEALLAAIPDIIMEVDANKVYTWANPAGLEFFGSDVIGKEAADYFEGEQKTYQLVQPLFNGDEKVIYVESWQRRKDGKKRLLAWWCNTLKDKNGNSTGALSSARDITDQRVLEDQFVQAQKMESVGRLAGGVAHDFNNMLSVILGYAELALEKIPEENPLYEDILEIQEAGRRAADVTRQLLAFARRQTIAPKILDLNEKVEGMLRMLRRLIGEDIDLTWHPGSGLWPVKLDPAQIDQILVNLCINAKDAISDVGKITIETDRVSIDNEYCADHPGFVPGDFVTLAVTDDGCGMDGETLEKIYEPFFTTKAVGQGTGLGLPTVYGIVKQNNGFINVYSEPGSGTTFKLYFSRHTAEAEKEISQVTEKLPEGRGETVLVVEDDAMILAIVEKMLANLGYHPLTASGPGEAFEIAAAHEGEIDIVMTDVIMPGMNGRELSEQLKERYPNLRVLFMSGYTANVIAHHGVLEEGVVFIQKPFSRHDLAVRVREALLE